MNLNIIFIICNIIVLPGWILLIIFPGWKITKLIIYSYFIPLFIGVVYLFFIIYGRIKGMNTEGGNFSSLDGLQMLFSNKITLLVGWCHYLAFDLFVGSWEVKNAEQNKINHFAVIPCLLLTLMLGPAGLLLYLIIRMIWKKKIIFTD